MEETQALPSSLGDDETDTLTDFQGPYDDRFLSSRGRAYTCDPTRSRSQAVVTTRPGPIGGGYSRQSLNWPMDSLSNPLSIPNNRYNEPQAAGNQSVQRTWCWKIPSEHLQLAKGLLFCSVLIFRALMPSRPRGSISKTPCFQCSSAGCALVPSNVVLMAYIVLIFSLTMLLFSTGNSHDDRWGVVLARL
jgi:hypothetical protein